MVLRLLVLCGRLLSEGGGEGVHAQRAYTSECELLRGKRGDVTANQTPGGEVNSGRNSTAPSRRSSKNLSEDGAFTHSNVRENAPCSLIALPAAPPCRPRSSAQVGGARFRHADPRQDADRRAPPCRIPDPLALVCAGRLGHALARSWRLPAATARLTPCQAHTLCRALTAFEIAAAAFHHHHRRPPPPPTPHRQTPALTQTQPLPLHLTLTRQDRSCSRRPARRLCPRLPASASGGGP